MRDFLALLRHELRLHARQMAAWAPLALFFIAVVVLAPFALGPDADLLLRLAPGLIWLAALLMSLLALERLFVLDARDGTLDIMLLSPLPLPLIVAGKLCAEIIVMDAAVLLMLLPSALMLGLSMTVLPTLIITLVLGIPVLVLLGGVMAAITASLSRNPALLTLLLVPFYIPLLIFAVAACDAAAMKVDALPHLLFMGAGLALLLPTAPFVIAAALREGQG